ncbi:hypothetical protein [Mesorhizobium sp. WSM4313]|uniref:hypothetical protein n=1 Tax=Mesorhizobium sp. WSM4313 TaxID=2029412 RepID=UPI001140D6F0|nr:hypothetical protein [Mesorhizobium sp. WSM4313]
MRGRASIDNWHFPAPPSLFQAITFRGQPQQARDKRFGIDYMNRMIHLTASFWYFYFSSLAAGGLRSI